MSSRGWSPLPKLKELSRTRVLYVARNRSALAFAGGLALLLAWGVFGAWIGGLLREGWVALLGLLGVGLPLFWYLLVLGTHTFELDVDVASGDFWLHRSQFGRGEEFSGSRQDLQAILLAEVPVRNPEATGNYFSIALELASGERIKLESFRRRPAALDRAQQLGAALEIQILPQTGSRMGESIGPGGPDPVGTTVGHAAVAAERRLSRHALLSAVLFGAGSLACIGFAVRGWLGGSAAARVELALVLGLCLAFGAWVMTRVALRAGVTTSQR